MTILNLVAKEMIHRKLNFSLAVIAVAMAVALYVSFETTGKASTNETRKLMLELGQNLRIIPQKTRMDKFWATGFSEYTMPAEYASRFTKHKGFSYTHLTATLHKAIEWRGKHIILTGIMPEVFPPDKRHQKPMTFNVAPGSAYVGFELADSLGIKQGDIIDIRGKVFTVAKTLSPSGSNDDIRIYGSLGDIQDILKLPGRINEIKALECMCFIKTDQEPLKAAKKELAELLPEAKVLLLKGIADIRFKQRTVIRKHMDFIMLSVIIGCGLFIGVLAMLNVRARKKEIGILRALGYSSINICILFLGKAVLIGVAGAVVGFFCGSWLALKFGPEIFLTTAAEIKPVYFLLIGSLIWAPVFAAISSFVPAAIAISDDPAQTLGEE